jgi:hypothetical protein
MILAQDPSPLPPVPVSTSDDAENGRGPGLRVCQAACVVGAQNPG